jgi:poly(ribitol-phosphate) beta-N-acetylglucosaminyltransferase
MDRIREKDPSIDRIAGPFVDRRVAVPTPTYFSHWGSMEKFAVDGQHAIDSWGERDRPYDRIYSRAQFAASHFLAAAYKLRHPGVTWVAEFSDPLARDVHNRERGTPVQDGPLQRLLRKGLRERGLAAPEVDNCFVWCEEIAYALADELVFTNHHQLDFMMGYCARPDLVDAVRAKAIISPHPTLPAVFYGMTDPDYELEPGVAHLAYFGNFYATRGMDDVLRALATVDADISRRLRLHVFTPGTQELTVRAAELGVSECVRVAPYVRYLDFLALTTRFDCLLVNDATTGDSHGRNPYLPSKWSDYRGSGTAVWGVCEAGSTLSEQELAYTSPIGDVSAAAEVLVKLAGQVSR